MIPNPERTTATFTAPAVHCGSCLANIEEALGSVEGIAATETDLDSKTVKVDFDQRIIGATEIADLIRDSGYDVTGITS